MKCYLDYILFESKTSMYEDAILSDDPEKIKKYFTIKNINTVIVDNLEMTPLNYSIWRNKYNSFLTLLEIGADVNLADKNSFTPLLYACYFSSRSSFKDVKYKMVKILLEKGVNVNANLTYTEELPSILFYISDPHTIKLLIDSGADIMIKNNKNEIFLDTFSKDLLEELKIYIPEIITTYEFGLLD